MTHLVDRAFCCRRRYLAATAASTDDQRATSRYIEPRVSGTVLSISPFVVLFSVFLWTFLWGLFGAFIGVPITIALLTFCAQHPSTQWLANLLGGPKGAPPLRELQRPAA
jgi:AI-2E family transporter